MTDTTRPQPRVRKLTVEPDKGIGYLAMDEDGQTRGFNHPREIVRYAKRRDRCDPSGFVVTVIEWRDMPAGFIPPTTGYAR